ncbi:MAG TPA: FAD-dependent oxidoreductase [Planctomycetota bacterium]|nr:FAD-dependent oxidoreductase [Planctomycetota bacterium]
MRIAIIGTGIAGMVAGRTLHGIGHELVIYEASTSIGGHTNTIPVTIRDRTYAIDTGFIVFNDWTYPNFIALLDHLGVASQPTTMSFSVRDGRSGLEYNGTSLNTVFAQRRNLLRPAFWRMIRDILRFGREAPALLSQEQDDLTLGEYVARNGYSRQFVEHYLLPMGGAIWSAGTAAMRTFPARYFIRFFKNHGMLSVDERPQWRVITGGSWTYAKALVAPFRDRIRLDCPVESVRRDATGVTVVSKGQAERFDQVVIATHGDQALRLLSDPSPREQEVLSAFSCTRNLAVLHTDTSVMPQRRRAWAAWNYHLDGNEDAPVPVTYDMSALQGIDAPERFLVTLNPSQPIAPERILRRITYQHPHYSVAAVAAQRRWHDINGINRTWFCGAYWGYGFHEDGVSSALQVAERFGAGLAQCAVR